MLIFLCWLLCGLSFAAETPVTAYGGLGEMNGIAFQDHQDFLREWTLVTIRFRKDTGEMRLTYANKLALDTLVKGKTNYPDGAVFAKTGIITGGDSQFPSSVVPRGVRRYQIMVKNAKKYPGTDGWGYALFAANGRTYPEEPIAAQNACHACHEMVENRGYVFSEPFDFTAKVHMLRTSEPTSPQLTYVNVKYSELPALAQEAVGAGVKTVRRLVNAKLEAHVFPGTLDELKPALESEAMRTQQPAIFMDREKKRFVVVRPLKLPECLNELGGENITTMPDGKLGRLKVCFHD